MARILGILALILVIGSAAIAKTIPEYQGDPVTAIVVHKEARKMFLMHDNRVLRSYNIGLGFAPSGHKAIEGDGKTPEGLYFIDRKNPNSKFHLSLGVSYPNTADRRYAKSIGKSPGGDIFIHGNQDLKYRLKRDWRNAFEKDWTAGCIAVTDAEMTEIYSMIGLGTPIFIQR